MSRASVLNGLKLCGILCFAVLVLLVFFRLATASETSLTLNGDPGNPIVGAQRVVVAPPDGRFSLDYRTSSGREILSAVVSNSKQTFSLGFAAPTGQPLAVGSYSDAREFFGPAGKPLINVSSGGPFCGLATGNFEIKEFRLNSDNSVASLWVTFLYHCGGEPPAVVGDLRFNADAGVALNVPKELTVQQGYALSFDVFANESNGNRVFLNAASLPVGALFKDNNNNTGTFSWTPGFDVADSPTVTFIGTNALGKSDAVTTVIKVVGESSLRVNSQPGDRIGNGQHQFLTTAEGSFRIFSYDGVTISFDSLAHEPLWSLRFGAPYNQKLTVGTYLDAVSFPRRDPTRPGFDVSHAPNGCDTVTGHFEVKHIKYDVAGAVTEFWATFEQHCNGELPALNGEIRFNTNVFVNLRAPTAKLLDRGQTWTFDVTAVEANGNIVALTAENMPAGAVFTDHHDNTGTFAWTPSPNQKGDFTVTFRGNNGHGAANKNSTTITVLAETAVVLKGEPGDYIAGGAQYVFHPPDAEFSSQSYNAGLSFYVSSKVSDHHFYLDFAPPLGQLLTPGLYTGATRFDFQGRDTPGLDISGDGRGCNSVAGTFFVKQTSPGFWAVFEQHCEGSKPALFGEIRLNANVMVSLAAPLQKSAQRGQVLTFIVLASDINGRTVALSATGLPSGATFADHRNNSGTFTWTPGFSHEGTFTVTFLADNGIGVVDSVSTVITVVGESSLTIDSDPGDPLGRGQKFVLVAPDASFTAERNYNSGVSIDVRSFNRSWSLDFAAPNNQPLTVGIYDGAIRFPFQGTLAGLDISGDYSGCNTLTGKFRVKHIAYGPANSVNAFGATFEQHCDGAVPALYGEIRFNLNLGVSISAPLTAAIDPGRNLTVTVSASDVNNRSVLLSAAGLPLGATFTDHHNNTGTLLWTPGPDQEGLVIVTFQADNGQGGTDTVDITIKVAARLTIITSGNGTVIATGIDCPGDCGEAYANGTSVILVANPASGYQVSAWTGCDNVWFNQCTVQMARARTVSVAFGLITYDLVIFIPTQNGFVIGTGIQCPQDCTETFTAQSSLTLTASPAFGYQSRWSGCDMVHGNQCTVQMNYNRQVFAEFFYKESYPSQAYFPLRPGSTWTYSANGDCCVTITVLPGTTNIGGVEAKAVQDSDGYIQYFTNDVAGLRLLGEADANNGINVIYYPPIQLTGASMNIGETLNSSGLAVTNVGYFNYSASYKIETLDNVSVPLRHFPVLRSRGTVTIAGGGTLTNTVYLAKNIGVVKDLLTDGGTTYVKELVATNVNGVSDFDGDGKIDVGIYRDGTWVVIPSAGGANVVQALGGPTDTPVPADYDGDGQKDVAVYQAVTGLWTIKRSSDGVTTSVGHGGGAFIPVPGDYDGDGKADIAVYANGVWSIKRSSDGVIQVVAHGGPGWTPVPADYDGDGKTDAAVYINGAWSIKRSSDNVIAVSGHGGPSWIPVPEDYDGDGKADIAVYAGGAWSILRSSDNAITVSGHGGAAWIPVPADYDGDGKADIAVYNAAGAWSIKRSSDNAIQVVGHGGGPKDVPLN